MTVAGIIKSALFQLGKIPLGETYPSDWDTQMLDELNSMLQNWAVEGLNLHALTTSTPKTLTVGDPSYTIGTSADINNRRPVEIISAKVTLSGLDHSLDVYNSILRYQTYQDKSVQGLPIELFYDADYASALATLWLYPAPDAAYSLTMYTLTSLAPFAATTDTPALPPEYEYALSTNFAAHLLSVFGESNSEIRQKARDTKAALLTNNSKRLATPARFDTALLGTTGYVWDIQHG
jgi:hypothetical protein